MGVIKMNCSNVKECMCPKLTCPNHGNCCKCVIKHRETDSLPYCLFPDNNGDKSNRNHYEVLKKRFENSKWSNSIDKRRGKSSPRSQASRSANRPCKQCRFSPLCCLSATPSSGDTPQRPDKKKESRQNTSFRLFQFAQNFWTSLLRRQSRLQWIKA